ncbi:LasR-specific antiactivator QslA [Pseudomonas aeruginosa]
MPTRSKASSGPPSPSAATACPHRCRRTAFEVAFLTRLQQRLVAARRSG